MNICVIGCGYVGLVTGAVFADLGNEVICVDVLEERITQLKNGLMPIYEPGLQEMVQRNLADRHISFSTSLEVGMDKAEIIFICVGTSKERNRPLSDRSRRSRYCPLFAAVHRHSK